MLLNETIFFSYLNKYNCFEKNPSIAVGVSVGPDSLALVFLLSKWIKLKQGTLNALICLGLFRLIKAIAPLVEY